MHKHIIPAIVSISLFFPLTGAVAQTTPSAAVATNSTQQQNPKLADLSHKADDAVARLIAAESQLRKCSRGCRDLDAQLACIGEARQRADELFDAQSAFYTELVNRDEAALDATRLQRDQMQFRGNWAEREGQAVNREMQRVEDELQEVANHLDTAVDGAATSTASQSQMSAVSDQITTLKRLHASLQNRRGDLDNAGTVITQGNRIMEALERVLNDSVLMWRHFRDEIGTERQLRLAFYGAVEASVRLQCHLTGTVPVPKRPGLPESVIDVPETFNVEAYRSCRRNNVDADTCWNRALVIR